MDLLPPVGVIGIASLLAVVIGYLLNANRADRKEHRLERQEWDARFKALQDSHATEMGAIRDRVETLEGELRSERLRADRAQARVEALTGGTGI